MPIKDPEVAALDAEFNAADSTMQLAEYSERRASLRQAAQAERSAPAVVTESRLMVMFKRFALNAAKVHLESQAALMKRIGELEARCAALEARGAGVTIAAENAVVPGISELAERMAQLSATLSLPVRPIYDNKGILIGARRVERLDE